MTGPKTPHCTMHLADECDCPPRQQPTHDDLRYLRRFSDRCCAEVTRNGEIQPCDKTAVAVAAGDAESDAWWPVCPHHSRGRKMVPLTELIRALTQN